MCCFTTHSTPLQTKMVKFNIMITGPAGSSSHISKAAMPAANHITPKPLTDKLLTKNVFVKKVHGKQDFIMSLAPKFSLTGPSELLLQSQKQTHFDTENMKTMPQSFNLPSACYHFQNIPSGNRNHSSPLSIGNAR